MCGQRERRRSELRYQERSKADKVFADGWGGGGGEGAADGVCAGKEVSGGEGKCVAGVRGAGGECGAGRDGCEGGEVYGF